MSRPNVNEPGSVAPQTGQTGQAGRQHTPFFEISEDGGGDFHWCLWSGNGRQLATNPIPYARQKDALQAIKSLSGVAAKATIVVKSHAK